MESRKYLTRNEFEKLVKSIVMSTSPTKLRDLTIILLAEYCALRISEALTLKKSYYIRETQEIFCPRLKDSNSNTLKILDKDVLNVLNYYLDHSKENTTEYMFVAKNNMLINRSRFYTQFIKYCEPLNLKEDKDITFHCLKHTRGQFLADSGMDVKEVQYWLGHKNVRNTYIYFNFTRKQQLMMYGKLYNEYYNNHKTVIDMKLLENEEN